MVNYCRLNTVSQMSNANLPNILDWFKQSYPKEYDLAMEVNQRMDRILGQIEIPNPDSQTAPP
jgi:transcriptional regulatory protein LevR